MSFWDSKLIKDIEDGKLPVLDVSIENASIIKLCAGLLLVATISILIAVLFHKKS